MYFRNPTNRHVARFIIYLHIPKTAGTTLTNIICNQYERNVFYNVDKYGVEPNGVLALIEQLADSSTLCGHFWYGVHEYIQRPFTYITMLRNPVDQVISWFYFRYKSDAYLRYEKNLEDYLSDPAFDLENSNVQTRFMTGTIVPNLSLAKDHLDKDFTLSGITELFDESVFLMKEELGWNNIIYTKVNVNHGHPSKRDLPDTIIAKIIEKNQLDIELYAFAKRKLEQRIEELDENALKQLADFKSKVQS